MSEGDLAAAWKRCGYAVTAKGNGLVAQSPAPVEIQFDKGQISAIIDQTGRHLAQYELPPQLLTNMPDAGRAKRIVIQYSDLPPMLIQAVVSAEDKRFFEHPGFDVLPHREGILRGFERAPQRTGRVHDFHAAGAKSLAGSRQELEAQDGRGADYAASGSAR